jgi:hypothetical protein
MGEIPEDLPWKVHWDKRFEDDVEEKKASGAFEKYKKQIIQIVENPIEVGKYKSEDYKGLKTVHVSGETQDIICFELTPGINNKDQREKIDEVYLHYIDHWDNYGSALTGRQPADIEYRFAVKIPYLNEGYDVEAVSHEVFSLAEDIEGLSIEDLDWKSEHLHLTGIAEPSTRERLESVLPDVAEIRYDDPDPF